VRTLNIDEPLARIEADGTVRYYHADALGSVTALTDASESVQTRYKYESFGKTEMTLDDGHGAANPFRYTGRELDETGDYYYRARYYNPVLGRFISEDPIGLLGGINLYSYVGNNSINGIDPFGLDWLEDVSNFSAGFGDTISSGFGLTGWVGRTLFDTHSWDKGLSGWVRLQMDTDQYTDPCSGFYKGGTVAGYAWGIAFSGTVAARTIGTSTIVKVRATTSADAATSQIIKVMSRISGRTLKVTHRVIQGGKIVHQDIKFLRFWPF
jgi:RHS repeat-associated protein